MVNISKDILVDSTVSRRSEATDLVEKRSKPTSNGSSPRISFKIGDKVDFFDEVEGKWVSGIVSNTQSAPLKFGVRDSSGKIIICTLPQIRYRNRSSSGDIPIISSQTSVVKKTDVIRKRRSTRRVQAPVPPSKPRIIDMEISIKVTRAIQSSGVKIFLLFFFLLIINLFFFFFL